MSTVPGQALAAEEPGTLPDGWTWEKLEDVATVNPSTPFNDLQDDTPIPFVPMAAVAEESGIIDYSRRRSVGEVRKGYVRFREGDVIFAKITPCMENGKTAPVAGLPGGYAAGSTEFHVFRPQCVEPRYLWFWLVRRAFRDDAERNMSGSAGQLRVPIGYLRSTVMPIPPLREQRRIVARVDELFAGIAEGDGALEQARAGLETWRRALLKAAVSGELTHDWRRVNRKTESAAAILADIRAAREGGEREVRFGRRRTDLDSSAPANLPALPPGWSWAQMADVTIDARNGISIKGAAHPPGVAALRLDALAASGINYMNVRYIQLDGDKTNTLALRKGDLLISRANGSPHLVGRARLVRDIPFECVFPDTIIRHRVGGPKILAEWLEAIWESALIRTQISKKAKTTAGILKISQDDIADIVFPVPPPLEMTACIEALSALTQSVTDMSVILDQVRQDGVALRQSILKSAFQGSLMTQQAQ